MGQVWVSLSGTSVYLSLRGTDEGVYLSGTSVGVSEWDRCGIIFKLDR